MIRSDGGGAGLFLSPVPEPPGDPAALSRGAATYTAAHGELERNRATLTNAAGQAGGPAWSGAGAAGFVTAAEELAAAYALTSSALAQGASTLRAYASDLAAAKETARRANAAIAETNSLATALLNAESAAGNAQSAADGAAQAAVNAEAQAAAAPHSATARVAADSARSAANEAQSAAQDAWNRVNALSGQYDAARSHALSLAGQARAQASQAAAKASAGFEAATADLFGVKPRPARGGAHGVPGGGLTWPEVVSNLAKWNDTAGWALNSWGAFGAFVTGRKELGYLGASSTLRSAYAAEDEAFWKFYGREGSYFDWAPKMRAYNTAADGARDALKELRGSITPEARSAMGVVGRIGLVAGIGSDVITEISPNKSFGPDGLLGGNTDRVMAGLNIGASGLALGDSFGIAAASTAMAIPGVDVVVGGVLVGTAVYAGGEFVYQHWHGIEHGISSAVSWVGHELGL